MWLTFSRANNGQFEMQLPAPWRAMEYLFPRRDGIICTADNWAYATTVAEISQWCLHSKQRLGYPEDCHHLTYELENIFYIR